MTRHKPWLRLVALFVAESFCLTTFSVDLSLATSIPQPASSLLRTRSAKDGSDIQHLRKELETAQDGGKRSGAKELRKLAKGASKGNLESLSALISIASQNIPTARKFIQGLSVKELLLQMESAKGKNQKRYDSLHHALTVLTYEWGNVNAQRALGELHRYRPDKAQDGSTRALPMGISEKLRKPFKVIITDLDDSLTRGNPPEGEEAFEAETQERLHRARSRGVQIAAISGRDIEGVRSIYIEKLTPEDRAGQWVYVENGSRGFQLDANGDLNIDSPLFLVPISKDPLTIEQLMNAVEEVVRKFSISEGLDAHAFLPLKISQSGEVVTKLTVPMLQVSQEVRDRLANTISRLLRSSPSFEGIQVFASSVAVGISRADKGMAIRHLLGQLDIDSAEVLIVGDGRNDLPMYKALPRATKLHLGVPYPGLPEDVIVSPIEGTAGFRIAFDLIEEAYRAQDGGKKRDPLEDSTDEPTSLTLGFRAKDNFQVGGVSFHVKELPYDEVILEIHREGKTLKPIRLQVGSSWDSKDTASQLADAPPIKITLVERRRRQASLRIQTLRSVAIRREAQDGGKRSWLAEHHPELEGKTIVEATMEMALSEGLLRLLERKLLDDATLTDEEGMEEMRKAAMAGSIGGIGPLLAERIIALGELGADVIGVSLLYDKVWVQRPQSDGTLHQELVKIPPHFRKVLEYNRKLKIEMYDGKEVEVTVWRAPKGTYGKGAVYFLDIPHITDTIGGRANVAYPGGSDVGERAEEARFNQSWILGRGTLALLKVLHQSPDHVVISETSSMFVHHRLFQDRFSRDSFFNRTRYIFNDHTPLEYAHPRWSADHLNRLHVNPNYYTNLPVWKDGTVDATAMIVNASDMAFGVSRKHSRTMRAMSLLYPFRDKIRFVTNGVSPRYWPQAEFQDPEKIASLSDEELLKIKQTRKRQEFAWFARREGLPVEQFEQTVRDGPPIALWTRRIVEYKQLGRLTDILENPGMRERFLKTRMVIIFGGRTHQDDAYGFDQYRRIQGLIQEDPRLAGRIFFFENYNVWEAPKLVQLSDFGIMLAKDNREAAATRFMKDRMNGVLLIGSNDGAVPESVTFYDGTNEDAANGFNVPYDADGQPTAEGLLRGLEQASGVYRNRQKLGKMVRNALNQASRVSVERTAKDMLGLLADVEKEKVKEEAAYKKGAKRAERILRNITLSPEEAAAILRQVDSHFMIPFVWKYREGNAYERIIYQSEPGLKGFVKGAEDVRAMGTVGLWSLAFHALHEKDSGDIFRHVDLLLKESPVLEPIRAELKQRGMDAQKMPEYERLEANRLALGAVERLLTRLEKSTASKDGGTKDGGDKMDPEFSEAVARFVQAERPDPLSVGSIQRALLGDSRQRRTFQTGLFHHVAKAFLSLPSQDRASKIKFFDPFFQWPLREAIGLAAVEQYLVGTHDPLGLFAFLEAEEDLNIISAVIQAVNFLDEAYVETGHEVVTAFLSIKEEVSQNPIDPALLEQVRSGNPRAVTQALYGGDPTLFEIAATVADDTLKKQFVQELSALSLRRSGFSVPKGALPEKEKLAALEGLSWKELKRRFKWVVRGGEWERDLETAAAQSRLIFLIQLGRIEAVEEHLTQLNGKGVILDRSALWRELAKWRRSADTEIAGKADRLLRKTSVWFPAQNGFSSQDGGRRDKITSAQDGSRRSRRAEERWREKAKLKERQKRSLMSRRKFLTTAGMIGLGTAAGLAWWLNREEDIPQQIELPQIDIESAKTEILNAFLELVKELEKEGTKHVQSLRELVELFARTPTEQSMRLRARGGAVMAVAGGIDSEGKPTRNVLVNPDFWRMLIAQFHRQPHLKIIAKAILLKETGSYEAATVRSDAQNYRRLDSRMKVFQTSSRDIRDAHVRKLVRDIFGGWMESEYIGDVRMYSYLLNKHFTPELLEQMSLHTAMDTSARLRAIAGTFRGMMKNGLIDEKRTKLIFARTHYYNLIHGGQSGMETSLENEIILGVWNAEIVEGNLTEEQLKHIVEIRDIDIEAVEHPDRFFAFLTDPDYDTLSKETRLRMRHAKDGGERFPSIGLKRASLNPSERAYQNELKKALIGQGFPSRDSYRLADTLVRYKDSDTLRSLEREGILPEGFTQHLEQKTVPPAELLSRFATLYNELKRLYIERKLSLAEDSLLYRLVPPSWLDRLMLRQGAGGPTVTLADVWYFATHNPNDTESALANAVAEAKSRHLPTLWKVYTTKTEAQDGAGKARFDRRIEHLGGHGQGGILKMTPFGGEAWIGAGSYIYRLWVDKGTLHFQRHTKDRKVAEGASIHYPLWRKSFTVGKQFGDYKINDDDLEKQHFTLLADWDAQDIKFYVEDHGTSSGTTVEWNLPEPLATKPKTQLPAIESLLTQRVEAMRKTLVEWAGDEEAYQTRLDLNHPHTKMTLALGTLAHELPGMENQELRILGELLLRTYFRHENALRALKGEHPVYPPREDLLKKAIPTEELIPARIVMMSKSFLGHLPRAERGDLMTDSHSVELYFLPSEDPQLASYFGSQTLYPWVIANQDRRHFYEFVLFLDDEDYTKYTQGDTGAIYGPVQKGWGEVLMIRSREVDIYGMLKVGQSLLSDEVALDVKALEEPDRLLLQNLTHLPVELPKDLERKFDFITPILVEILQTQV